MSPEQEEQKQQAHQNGKGEQNAQPPIQDHLVVTQHQITIDGQSIPYTVTAGTIVLKEEVEKGSDKNSSGGFEGEQPKASLFFIAYTRDDVEDEQRRPLSFAFNGGPGSSSVWLHLGLLGPKRVLLDDDGSPYPPPYRLVENAFSLLDETDLVFIDPVSTGFSRPAPGEKSKRFHGFKKDIESVGDFIRLYTSRYGRWGSPKFLIGESYGTTRAAGLAGYLQDRHGLYLNGLMLVSSVLNFQTLEFEIGNDLPYILILPTYTATAWYHKRLPPDLQNLELEQAVQQAQDFALGEYNTALMKGAALPDDERQVIAEQLARFTGLSPEYIQHTDLRVEIFRFIKQLLRDQGRTVGRLDSRFTGFDRDQAGEHPEYDPSSTNINGPYTAMFNDYVRRELEFHSDLPYEIINPRVWPWSFAEHENRFLDVAETLRKALTINPFMRVFVANGYYDLATPYLATEYTFNHLSLEPSLQANISMGYYPAGHMMYIHLPSLEQLKHDLAAFIRQSLPATTSGETA